MFHFIVNKSGGSGRAFFTWKITERYLKKYSVDYVLHESMAPGHASKIAKELSSGDEDDVKIIVIGGDGTINEVLNGIADFSKVRFGVIPSGSGNDFAHGLKIKTGKLSIKRNIKKMIESVNSNSYRTIDLGLVRYKDSSRYFGISSGLGMDAIVCKKTLTSKLKVVLNKLHLGKLIYIILTIRSLFTMKCNEIKVKFDDEEEITIPKMIMIAGMNLISEGGGVKMAPTAKENDGELSVCMVYGIPKVLAFLVFPFLIFGLHTIFKGFTVRNFKKMTLKCDEELVLHTDGEWAGDYSEVTMECVPDSLKLMN